MKMYISIGGNVNHRKALFYYMDIKIRINVNSYVSGNYERI